MKQEDKKDQHSNPNTTGNDDGIKDAPEILQLTAIAERMKRRELYLPLFIEKTQMN